MTWGFESCEIRNTLFPSHILVSITFGEHYFGGAEFGFGVGNAGQGICNLDNADLGGEMAYYLELTQAVIWERESASSSADSNILHLNEVQSNNLWRVIRVVYNYLSSSQLPAPHNRRHKYLPKIFQEFYVIVTRAKAIVQEFSTKRSWLQAAVLQGNNHLAFKQLILDLQMSVTVFEEIAQHNISFDTSRAIWRPDGDMDRDAQSDAENLRSRVEDLLAQPAALSEEERLLAEYLSERERSMLNPDSQNVELPAFCIAKGGYPTLGIPIGHGGSGAVYKVEFLGMECAKKHFGATEDDGVMDECLKEVSVLSKLNHPHIVKLLCVSAEREVSFLMELMPMSLHKFIKEWWKNQKCGIMAEAAIDIMLQIARGMEHLHEQGIVHRDLKASNILVAPSRVEKLRDLGFVDVKLTDFGLAKMKVHDLIYPSRVAGTTQWRAPEAFTKDEAIDWKKADAWSFAMTCSEMLTGMKPYSDGPLGKVKERITFRRERPRLPSACPRDLVLLLERCWDSRPSVRPHFREIRETLTSIKGAVLEFQWNDHYPGKILKKLDGRKYVMRSWNGISDLSQLGCSLGLLVVTRAELICMDPPSGEIIA